MDVKTILRTVETFTRSNSTVILTGIGVVGVVTTAVLTADAARRVERNCVAWEEVNGQNYMKLGFKERFIMAAPYYAPATLSAIATIGAIIGAQKINERRQAAVAAAYGLAQQSLIEYRDEVTQFVGARKEEQIRANVAQKSVEKAGSTEGQTVIITGGGETLCFEKLSGRYFLSSAEKIRRAENEFNKTLFHEGYASLNQFYDLLQLENTDLGAQLGWQSDQLLELSLTSHLTEDERPALAISYNRLPGPDFYRFGAY